MQTEYLPGTKMRMQNGKNEFVSSEILLSMRFPTDMHILLKTPPALFYLIDFMWISNFSLIQPNSEPGQGKFKELKRSKKRKEKNCGEVYSPVAG